MSLQQFAANTFNNKEKKTKYLLFSRNSELFSFLQWTRNTYFFSVDKLFVLNILLLVEVLLLPNNIGVCLFLLSQRQRCQRLFKQLNMPAGSEEDVEDYLDDPISLVAFEDMKIETCDSDTDIIDLVESTDEESTCTSSYGKRDLVLPVTFFDISRNVRLLNKCKPMSVRIVDCKQHPSYSKYIREDKQCSRTPMNRPDSYDEIIKKRKERRKQSALKCKDLSRIDFKRNKGLVGLKITGNIFQKIIDSEMAMNKTRRISVENKSKGRCESHKKTPLNEMKLVNLDDSKHKEVSETNTKAITSKPSGNSPDDKCKEQTKSDKQMLSIKMNSDVGFAGDKSKENSETNTKTASIEMKCNSSNDESGERTKTNTEKIYNGTKNNVGYNYTNTTIETNMTFSDAKFKDRTKSATKQEKSCTETKSNSFEDQCKEKGESNTKKTITETKNNMCEDKCKENANNKIKKPFVEMKSNLAKDKNMDNKDESETCTEKLCFATVKNTSIISNGKVESNTNKPLLITDSVVPKYNENCKSILFKKKNGAALDDIGRSIIPINDANTNKDVPKNRNMDSNYAKNSVQADARLASDKDKSEHNNENNQMRCSLKISCKKIIAKALELKQAKSNEAPPDTISNTVVRQNQNEIINNGDQTLQKLNLKRNHRDVESFSRVSSKDKKKHKKQKRTSSKSKRVEKSSAKDTNKDNQAGSPIIPCTTITVRTAQPKLSRDIPVASQTQKQNTSTLSNALPRSNQEQQQINKKPDNVQTKPLTIQPNSFVVNETGTNKGSITTSNNSVSHSNIPANVVVESSTVSDQNSNSTSKVAERKYPYIFVRTCEPKTNLTGTTITENRLLDQSMKPMNSANPIITVTKSVSTGNASPARNLTTHGVIKNQTNPHPQVTSPPTLIRPLHPDYSGHNPIILRKLPPLHHMQNNASNRGQPIQTVINNREQNLTFPIGGKPMRFQALPQYQSPNTNIAFNFSSVRPVNQNFFPQSRTSNAYMRGTERGLSFCQVRFPELSYPIGQRYPLPPPPPPPSVLLPPSASTPTAELSAAPMPPPPPHPHPSKVPLPQNRFKHNLGLASVTEISKDSVIGSTADGELIKKINIVAKPANSVNEKDMMLAELNHAVMSPELTVDEPTDKSKEISLRKPENDSKAQVNSTYSKPCPLSKKINRVEDLNRIPEKPAPQVGYSPPILPILTYEEILSQSDKYKKAMNIKNVDNTAQKRKIRHTEIGKQHKANKISLVDYRRRVSKDDVDGIDVSKVRKAKNADDYNLDQGYDSDSTVKL